MLLHCTVTHPGPVSSKQEIAEGVVVHGGTSLTDVDSTILQQIPPQFQCQKVWTFYRLEIKGQLLYSEPYLRPKKRNSYIVFFHCSESSEVMFGHIVHFISIPQYGILSDIRPLVPWVLLSEAFELCESMIDYGCNSFLWKSPTPFLLVPLVSKFMFISFPCESLHYVALMNTDLQLD